MTTTPTIADLLDGSKWPLTEPPNEVRVGMDVAAMVQGRYEAVDPDVPTLLARTGAFEGQEVWVTSFGGTYKRFGTGSGAIWRAWSKGKTSFVPTWQNFNPAGSQLSANYWVIDGMLHVLVSAFIQSGAQIVSTDPFPTFPVSNVDTAAISNQIIGLFGWTGASGALGGRLFWGTYPQTQYAQVSGSLISHGTVTTNTPQTLSVGNAMSWNYVVPMGAAT